MNSGQKMGHELLTKSELGTRDTLKEKMSCPEFKTRGHRTSVPNVSGQMSRVTSVRQKREPKGCERAPDHSARVWTGASDAEQRERAGEWWSVSETPFYLPSARRPRPGQPRKHPESGHSPGTGALQVVENTGANGSALAWQAIGQVLPRLLDVEAASQYLGVSTWVTRALVDAGTLKRVRLPMPDGRDLRKLLFDRADLDRLIDGWKE